MTKWFAERSALMRKAAFGGFIDLSVCEVGTAQRERSAVGSSAQRPARRTRPSAARRAALRGAGSEGSQRNRGSECRQRVQAAKQRQQMQAAKQRRQMQAANAGSVTQAARRRAPERTAAAQRSTRQPAPRGASSFEKHHVAFATQIIPICTFQQLKPTCAAARMIAPFSRPMNEVPSSTGGRGKEETSGVFPLGCQEILEGCKSDWGTTRVVFSTSGVSADPRLDPAGGFGFLEFLLMPHQLQLTQSSPQLTPSSNYKASQWLICAGETLPEQEKLGKRMECGGSETLPELSKPAPLLPPAGGRGKNSFGTCTEKSSSFPGQIYQSGGFLQLLCTFTNTIRRGCRG
ncbi:uncharacterized protein LOC135578756 [Columba livia]|uniref:uncharacterized protein LOC135578756 n=1 Tax=Columba livia TaxID=8932 RepID=UPI0031BB1478